MLLDVDTITDDQSAAAIHTAILARDPAARVGVDVAAKRVRVDGAQDEQAVIAALAAAGFPAVAAAPHSGPGSDCCGGCS